MTRRVSRKRISRKRVSRKRSFGIKGSKKQTKTSTDSYKGIKILSKEHLVKLLAFVTSQMLLQIEVTKNNGQEITNIPKKFISTLVGFFLTDSLFMTLFDKVFGSHKYWDRSIIVFITLELIVLAFNKLLSNGKI